MAGKLPETFDKVISDYKKELAKKPPHIATRNSSQNALDVINAAVPETMGGSADLTGSNNTKSKDMAVFSASNYAGRYVHYGIREHGMAAAMNGLALMAASFLWRHLLLLHRLLPPLHATRLAHGHPLHLRDDP